MKDIMSYVRSFTILYRKNKYHKQFGEKPRENLDDQRERSTLLKSLEANYPFLCKDRQIILVDCTKFARDPELKEKSRHLVEHSGWHPENLENLVTDRNLKRINMGC